MKDAITKQADEMVAKCGELVEKVKPGAGLVNEKSSTTIKELIAKANLLLEQGKFNEAMAEAVAEKAKKQLETAVSEETHEELKSTTREKIKDIKDSLSNKLKGLSE